MKRPAIAARRAPSTRLIETGCALLWLSGTLPVVFAGDPPKFLVNDADAFRKRALEEIQKAQPETDVHKLTPNGFSYVCDKLSDGTLDRETLSIKFIDPGKGKITDGINALRTITIANVVVDFSRNLLNGSAVLVRVHTSASSRMAFGSGTPKPLMSPFPTLTPVN